MTNPRGIGLAVAVGVLACAVGFALAKQTITGPPGLSPTDGNAPISAPQAAGVVGTLVQSTTVTTDATGAWSVTWNKAFVSSTPYTHAEPVVVSGLPMICTTATRTNSGATGKCYQTMTTTLPGTLVALGGLVVSPVSNAGAGIAVQVVARDLTQ